MPLTTLHALLNELEALVAHASERARDVERDLAARHDALDQHFAAIRALAARAPGSEPPQESVNGCAEPGWVFLSSQATLDTLGDGPIRFEIGGNKGSADFVFTSGMAQADIIRAINAFTGRTGVRAAQEPKCVEIIALRSELPGADQFVRAAQVEPREPLRLLTSACDGQRLENLTVLAVVDWGLGIAGDIDCDADVDVDDLVALLTSWGDCPKECPEDINGDGVVDTDDLLALLRNWTR